MKIYKGKRLGELGEELNTGSDVIVIVSEDGKVDRRLEHHVYHSPTGFSWGYGGSGPADLARSILWDFLGKEPARELYMNFKDKFVSGWKDEWQIDSYRIKDWIANGHLRI